METTNLPTGNALPTDPSNAPSVTSHTALSVTMGTSAEFRSRVAHITALASLADPFTSMLQHEKYPDDTNFQATVEQLAETNLVRINRKCDTGGFPVEAGDFAAVACWEPPECTSAPESAVDADEVERSGRRIFADFVRRIERRKRIVIGAGQRYWKLSLMARQPGRNDKGAVRAVMENGLGMAREKGEVVWVEAGNERARDVYAYFGFRVVEELKSGRGEYDREGKRRDGGEGVSTWLMVREWANGKENGEMRAEWW